MGVPGFFKWLTQKYPKIITYERPRECVPNSKPCLTNEEFDVLYLDMNSIIHQCLRSSPTSGHDLMKSIFRHVDRIISLVKPRKLVYIAIDGVAPKAKMNQQRSRRFKRSKETAERQATSQNRDHLDSNCITPGTEFMSTLSAYMHYYIHSRLSSFLHWKNITVIFSDANVPGEGEHKIVDFIRRQRQQPNYDLSTRHVMCGPDTDLIFLGLATHEAHVTIIREEQGSNHYTFVSLGVLRKYLEVDLRVKNLPFDFDLDHAIDDWVLLCTLIGNDFLPGLPFLTIEKGAIDTLVKIYKDCISKSKDWANKDGVINFEVFKLIFSGIERTKMTRIEKYHNPCGFKEESGQSKKRKSEMDSKEEKTMTTDEQTPYKKAKWDGGGSSSTALGFTNDRMITAVEYFRGICWVLKYYYQSVPSWTWFYPRKNAPFSSDMEGVSSSCSDFAEGTQPLLPLEQLMAVLPVSSLPLVPFSWRKLMTDPDSPIIDFYRTKPGSRDPLLPFVEEGRLTSALSKVDHKLSEAEKNRNVVGEIQLYVGQHNKGYDYMRCLVGKIPHGGEIYKLEPTCIGGICGTVFVSEKCVAASETLASPFPRMQPLHNCHVVCVNYRVPVLGDVCAEPSGKDGEMARLRLEAHGVVPDVIDFAPAATIMIKYGGDGELGSLIDGGNEIMSSLIPNQPTRIEWPVEEGAYYTLCLTNPDAPSRVNPTMREWHHWLVVNIPGNDVKKGEVLSEYNGSCPPIGSGLHRNVFLAYKQPGPLTCDELRLTNRSTENRENFSIRKFAEKYNLGQPIAGNMCLTKLDQPVTDCLV